jgi:hypothetical protein
VEHAPKFAAHRHAVRHDLAQEPARYGTRRFGELVVRAAQRIVARSDDRVPLGPPFLIHPLHVPSIASLFFASIASLASLASLFSHFFKTFLGLLVFLVPLSSGMFFSGSGPSRSKNERALFSFFFFFSFFLFFFFLFFLVWSLVHFLFFPSFYSSYGSAVHTITDDGPK